MYYRLIATSALFLLSLSAFSSPDTITLPYTWEENSISITIHGVFSTDDDTKEGWIGKDEKQYKVLIEYENTLSHEYNSKGKPVGVGYLKLKTNNENIYNPKYVGGAIVHSHLKPKRRYKTHNYAFNIHKTEKPVELLMYERANSRNPKLRFVLQKLIPPPLPDTTRIIEIGDVLRMEKFSVKPVAVEFPQFILKGPFVRNRYALAKARDKYKLCVVRIVFKNTSKTLTSIPLYTHDGDFRVRVTGGNVYNDLSPSIMLVPGNKYLMRVAAPADRVRYPLLKGSADSLNPGESVELIKAFEIPLHSNPIDIEFQLLGDVEKVIIRLKNKL